MAIKPISALVVLLVAPVRVIDGSACGGGCYPPGRPRPSTCNSYTCEHNYACSIRQHCDGFNTCRRLAYCTRMYRSSFSRLRQGYPGSNPTCDTLRCPRRNKVCSLRFYGCTNPPCAHCEKIYNPPGGSGMPLPEKEYYDDYS